MAVSTFYPSLDGRVYKTSGNDTWSNLVTGTGTAAEDSNSTGNAPLTDTGTTSGRFDFISRGIFLFDTSSIPDDDEITSATLSFYVGSKSTGITVSVNVVASNPASDSSLAAGDYQTVGSTKFSTAIAVSAISTSAYVDFNLNASGISAINKTGLSKFASRLEEDIDNSAPTWASNVLAGINVNFSESTGTSTDPKLVVTHAPPATRRIFMIT